MCSDEKLFSLEPSKWHYATQRVTSKKKANIFASSPFSLMHTWKRWKFFVSGFFIGTCMRCETPWIKLRLGFKTKKKEKLKMCCETVLVQIEIGCLYWGWRVEQKIYVSLLLLFEDFYVHTISVCGWIHWLSVCILQRLYTHAHILSRQLRLTSKQGVCRIRNKV